MSPVLSYALTATLALYLLAMALGMLRLLRGPSAQDRVLALDFVSVISMLILLMLAIRHGSGMYFESALLIAMFGFISSVAFAKFLLRGEVIE